MWQIFTLASCKCEKKKTLQHDKCKCKTFGHVSVNDLHLQWIYMSYILLLIFTCTTLVYLTLIYIVVVTLLFYLVTWT
jgi:hypothetical protein